MVLQVDLDHLFGQFPGRHAKIAPGPEMPPPVPLLHMRKFLKHLARCPPFNPTHDLAGRQRRGRRHQQVDMVFADDPPQNMDLQLLTDLPDQLPYAQRQIALQHPIAIFGRPDKVILDLIFGMTAFSIVHRPKIRQPLAESEPVSKTGVSTQNSDE